MPKPPAKFTLYKLYDDKVQLRFLEASHAYRIKDPQYKRDWEPSPSATTLTGSMEKGAGLMMYAMSESMKYIDKMMDNRSLKQLVDDEKFNFKDLFKEARAAHIKKSDLGKRVGTSSHDYVERFLKSLKMAQELGRPFSPPDWPRSTDIKESLAASVKGILEVSLIKSAADVEKIGHLLARDMEVRKLLWDESRMIERACKAAHDFFNAAIKARALSVWDVEKIVHSRELFFSGKFDSILEFTKDFTWRGYTIPKGVYLCDFKTSNPGVEYPMGIYPNYLAQLGLYDVALCEEFPELRTRIKGHLILGSSKWGDGFHPYLSVKRERNREWGKVLVPMMEYMHQAERELKHLNLYEGK